ncbi:MAG: plastocyanin/azurin family copper-binding protein [Planctomycetota bacterium]
MLLTGGALLAQQADAKASAEGVRALEASPKSSLPTKHGSVVGSITSLVKLRTRGARSQVDAVVYLEPVAPGLADAAGGDAKTGAKAAKKAPSKQAPTGEPVALPVAEVRQKRLKFQPSVLPIQVGTEVTFLNEDRVRHNVYIESDCCKIDQDANKGETVKRTFPQAGMFPVVCRLHPEMTMTVLALDTPWFAACRFEKHKADDGKRTYVASFELTGVPPGKYTLRSWNKKLQPLQHVLEVVAGKATKCTLTAAK